MKQVEKMSEYQPMFLASSKRSWPWQKGCLLKGFLLGSSQNRWKRWSTGLETSFQKQLPKPCSRAGLTRKPLPQLLSPGCCSLHHFDLHAWIWFSAPASLQCAPWARSRTLQPQLPSLQGLPSHHCCFCFKASKGCVWLVQSVSDEPQGKQKRLVFHLERQDL